MKIKSQRRRAAGRRHARPSPDRTWTQWASHTMQDGLTAAALATAALIGLLTHLDVNLLEGDREVFTRLDKIGVGLALLQTAPLVWRRRAPVWVFGTTGSALIAFSFLNYPPSLASTGFVLSLYTVATCRPRHVSVPVGIAAAMAVFVILLIGRQAVAPDAFLADYLIVGAAWFLGEGLRLRRRYTVELEDRTTRLDRERMERTHRAVAQERRVIARELHDVVAHNVSVIVAQAAGAQRVFHAQPSDALAALAAIENSGREALVEMRRLTSFLRTDEDGATSLSPQPGLRNVPALLAQVRKAGVPVTLITEGLIRPLPAGLDLSGFRIVQEALTNVLKHAGPAQAVVTVRYGKEGLLLSIIDDGNGCMDEQESISRIGYGQLGMGERVALFGGDLQVGGRPEGGYEVRASLPLERDGATP